MMKLCALIASIGLMAGVAQGGLITFFDLGTAEPIPNPVLPAEEAPGVNAMLEAYGNNLVDNGYTGVTYTHAEVNDGNQVSAGRALGWGSGVNEGENMWEMSLDLTGWTDVKMQYGSRATTTGPDTLTLNARYHTGSEWSTWEEFSTPTLTGDSNWHLSGFVDLPEAVFNKDSVQIRMFIGDEGSGTGTFRVDNIHVSGIPEPGTIALLALGLAGVFGLRRKLVG